jgi:hypothetical protein
MCRLSGNNRPITDYLKNSRLIGFADYLPINRLIPSKAYWGTMQLNGLNTLQFVVYILRFVFWHMKLLLIQQSLLI